MRWHFRNLKLLYEDGVTQSRLKITCLTMGTKQRYRKLNDIYFIK